MDKPINERFVKLSSRLPFPRDLELDQNVEVIIDGQNTIGSITKTEDMDNQDGTINKIYTIKFLSE